jgi:hypothetical protein
MFIIGILYFCSLEALPYYDGGRSTQTQSFTVAIETWLNSCTYPPHNTVLLANPSTVALHHSEYMSLDSREGSNPNKFFVVPIWLVLGNLNCNLSHSLTLRYKSIVHSKLAWTDARCLSGNQLRVFQDSARKLTDLWCRPCSGLCGCVPI